VRGRAVPRQVSSFFDYPTLTGDAAHEDVFLRDRSEDDWERLLAHTEAVRFAAGDILIRAGERERSLYVLASGRLELLLPGESGEIRIGTIEPRTVVGEMAFFDSRPRSATLHAVTDGELHELRFEAFETLAARYPELGRAILLDLGRILAGRLRLANEALDVARRR
jgi:CRP-like cAMP-binding protein